MARTSLRRVVNSDRLPSLPAIAVRVISLVQRPDVNIDELAEAISADPALTAKLLRTANSGFYGRSREVARLHDAVMILGLRNVKTLALGFTLVGSLRRGERSGFDHLAFWERSLYAAMSARALAALVAPGLRDEAFLAGLLHGIGVLALNQTLGQAYRPLLDEANGDYGALLECERKAMGFDHSQVAAALGAKWNLPPLLREAISGHATPTLGPENARDLVRLVAIGTQVADVIVGCRIATAAGAYRSWSADWFGLQADEADRVIAQAMTDASLMEATFDIAGSAQLSADEILARANEALLELSLRANQENSMLEMEKEQLTAAAVTDGLTGLPNRRHLDRFLLEQLAIAARYGTPLSILMIDIDHFKEVNDRLGHRAGDRVLAETAEFIRLAVRASDFVGRYGGEEFVVVTPFTDLDGATETAERVRATISGHLVVAGGMKLGVTVSVGVATFSPGEANTPDALLEVADRALYAAKAAGRNRVIRSEGAAAA